MNDSSKEKIVVSSGDVITDGVKNVSQAQLQIPKEGEDIEGAGDQSKADQKKEINGPKGLEPTRYGDWESKGRCYDF